MEVFKPHEQGSTEKLDEEMAKYYGIPIESAREVNDKLAADALATAIQLGFSREQAPSDEQLDS